MHGFPDLRVCLVLCMALVIGSTITVNGAALDWTNGDLNPVYNGPDKPTLVTFSECVKILSISTYHWNYGKGDTPGKVTLFHDDGTAYGPWGTIGENGTNSDESINWITRPGEILKAGTYLVSDSNPKTWAQNDGSDNRGIATITYEPVICPDDTGEITNTSEEPVPAIPDESTGGVLFKPGDTDPATLPGGATDNEKVPVIEQVVFTPLYRSVDGGKNVYATLRVKNVGDRDLEDGYAIIRFISQDGTYSYRGGMGKIPPITVGEERDISLIIPTEGPVHNSTSTNTLFCTVYSMDGSISELMNGGYFESRGVISMPPEGLITVTGCCQEPYTADSIRGCGES